MNTIPNKRKDRINDSTNMAKRVKKVCSYGEDCYRRNPIHLKEFSHPHLESILDDYTGSGEYPIPENLRIQKQMIEDQLKIIVEKNLYTPHSMVAQTINNDASSSALDAADSNTGVDLNVDTGASSRLSMKEVNEYSSPKVEVKKKEEEVRKIPEQRQMTGTTSSKSSDSDYQPIVPPRRRIEDMFKVVAPRGRMSEKHARTAPYHIFYTTITDAPETHSQPNSVTFQELLDPSLGELKCSLQINFMVDIGWLLAQYYFAGYSKKRLTVLYGEDMPDIGTIGRTHSNVDTHLVTMATPFGKHHTKMGIYCYEDGALRVVVSTANLYVDDWENRCQGLWLSPRCPELPDSAMPHDGDSPTGFKRSLLKYLSHYQLPQLSGYVERVKRCDFSLINVFLVASAPGGHHDSEYGMSRMGALLRQHCLVPPAESHRWELVTQASSIGSFGKEPKLWLTGEFLSHMCRAKNQSALLASGLPKLKLIYPSLENVKQSHDGLLGGGCLPYAGVAHAKQPWLVSYLYQWKAKSSGRDRAMPHIKSYLRVSPDYKMCAFYHLTSGNVSKAAWGTVNKGNAALRIMSYEAGVLFLPRFVINEDFFPLEKSQKNHLPVPYDLPPVPYEPHMTPWLMDYLHR